MCSLKKLTVLQNKALRAIDNQTYNSPAGPLCKKYNVVKVNDLVDIELSKRPYQLSKNLQSESHSRSI